MKPSEYLARGECPFCLARGQVENVIDGVITCPLCRGTKKWPPPGDVAYDDDSLIGGEGAT